MSKRRPVPDVERTAEMVDLVHRCYPGGDDRMSLSHVVVEEVAPGTGWAGANRRADVLALGVWPSRGLTLDGYEVKASRADLKKELSDPLKHSALARYCDSWSLVAWDESVLVDGIPETWGIIVTAAEDGERVLVTKRKAAKLTPEAWPRNFVCSLVRNAYEQSPGAAYVARIASQSWKRGNHEGESNATAEMKSHLEPLARALYGADRWKWPDEARDPEALCKLAAERLMQGELTLRAQA